MKIIVLLVAFSFPIFAEVSPFWGDLAPGSYAVGFKPILSKDKTRTYRLASKVTTSRWIRALAWYPALLNTGRRMTLADLVEHSCPVVPLKNTASKQCIDALAKDLKDFADGEIADSQVNQLLALPLSARLHARRARGQFPVILFDTGMNQQADPYFALAEYLASHGYVVVVIPSFGHEEGKGLGFNVDGIKTKLRDLEFVAGRLPTLAGADKNRIAVAAWSVGGISTATLQTINRSVRAVLSLDGATGYEYGWNLLKDMPAFKADRADVPYLHFTGKLPNPYNVSKNFEYFSTISSGDSYLVQVEGFRHGSFISVGGVLPHSMSAASRQSDFWSANRAVVKYSRWFLDRYLKDDQKHAADMADPPGAIGQMLKVQVKKAASGKLR